jgi:hypothetical protein
VGIEAIVEPGVEALYVRRAWIKNLRQTRKHRNHSRRNYRIHFKHLFIFLG